MARIRNINGTSNNKRKCGSWLDHWKKHSKYDTNYCVVKTCTGKDLVGAHVQTTISTDMSWYIIPLCNLHNKSKEELEISDTYELVSANVKETCAM